MQCWGYACTHGRCSKIACAWVSDTAVILTTLNDCSDWHIQTGTDWSTHICGAQNVHEEPDQVALHLQVPD